jgi:UDP-N-acetylmuramoyl-L-alanyl-D-glutamate--2,6-diaminopimelate ligase
MIHINSNAFTFLSGQLNSLPDFLHSIDIKNLCFDSREVQQGDCYVALPSVAKNELEYIEQACASGAVLVICSSLLTEIVIDATLKVEDVMAFSGDLLHTKFGQVTNDMNVIGVTGTNGKSSICYYLAQLLEGLNVQSSVMGTLGYGKWNDLTVSGMTTLPLEKLHTVLRDLSLANDAVAMEVSSHGLEQQRLEGVKFKTAIFSNLTRDHLDYHGTMAAYGAEKSKLFKWSDLELAIVNVDDAYASTLLQNTSAQKVITYGTSRDADLQFSIKSLTEKGMRVEFRWNGIASSVFLPLYGEFNVYNVAAVIAYGLSRGVLLQQLLSLCSHLKPVLGRMQQVVGSKADPLVLVDYAHTPDALGQVLKSVKQHNHGKLILVVGCGGDRDQGKRALMGKIALRNSDDVIFTSDNPRTESPEKICQDMIQGLAGPFSIELDRKIAIEKAISMASSQDIVVIAGKVHEDYQEICGQKQYFSDVSVAEKAMRVETLV